MIQTAQLMTPDQMDHSHSALSRLIEEIEAHAQALLMEGEDGASILTDMEGFIGHFEEEVTAHIAEEENSLFPRMARRLGKDYDWDMERLISEHRELEATFDELRQALARAQESPSDAVALKSLHDKVRLLKFAFLAHSNHERLLLQRIDELTTTG